MTLGLPTFVGDSMPALMDAARANLGLYTQPISFIGLPVVVAPLQRPGGLPIGVQIIANHYKEAAALRVARHLEKQGVANAAPA